MSISIGLLDFREEKRIDEMFIASAFRIGALYPEVVFTKESNVDFLKSEVFEMTKEGDKLEEKALYLEKYKKAETRIKSTIQTDPTVNYSESIEKAVESINKDLADRKTILKQKLFNRNNDSKILKVANAGSAFAMERASTKPQGTEALNRHILTMSPVRIMPMVTMERSADLVRKIKSGYAQLLNKYVSIEQQTEAVLKMIQDKKMSGNINGISDEVAARAFAKGTNPEYFNGLLKKHKDMEMSPELPTKTNKPRINL
jgi:hypothetical protein